jgi:hypothetical protein
MKEIKYTIYTVIVRYGSGTVINNGSGSAKVRN